jgi:preprotein translocase subunit SecE
MSDKQNSLSRMQSFFGEVKTEVKKVVWPARKETMMTTLFVFIFAIVAGIYFLIVDQIIFKAIQWLIDFGGRL